MKRMSLPANSILGHPPGKMRGFSASAHVCTFLATASLAQPLMIFGSKQSHKWFFSQNMK